MRRSEINEHIREAKKLFASISFKLPPFAYWSAGEWKQKGIEADEIRDNQLGWDITDYGEDRFTELGLLLFTIRNGNYANRTRYPKGYAEKIMVSRENQVCPMHFHWKKREDIINRGGGNLIIEVYLADEKDGLSEQPFSITIDGVRHTCSPGEKIALAPGESICLEPRIYHAFYGEEGTGPVVVGEVSDVNDDDNDNRFLNPLRRFPEIEEDEPPLHLLCNEYPVARRLV